MARLSKAIIPILLVFSIFLLSGCTQEATGNVTMASFAPGDNLVQNGSFDNDAINCSTLSSGYTIPSGWRYWRETREHALRTCIDNKCYPSSSSNCKSFRADYDPNWTSYHKTFVLAQDVKLVPGKTYTLSGSIYLSNVTKGTCSINLYKYSSSSGAITIDTGINASTAYPNQWQSFSKDFTLPSSYTTTTTVELRLTGAQNGSCWFDNIKLVEKGILYAPTNVTATSGYGYIKLSWKAPTSGLVPDMYLIERNIMTGNTELVNIPVANTVTKYDDYIVMSGTFYAYRVCSLYKGYDMNCSGYVAGRALPPILYAPTNVTATPGYRKITLSWKTPAGVTPDEYVVKRVSSSGQIISTTSKITGNNLEYQGLSDNTTYYFRVCSRKTGYDENCSAIVSAKTLSSTSASLPAAPTNLDANANVLLNKVLLSWKDNSNNERGFAVERSTDSSCLTSGAGFTTIAFVSVSAAAPSFTIVSFTDSRVSSGVSYCYRVRAFNDAGSSSYSNTKKVIVP